MAPAVAGRLKGYSDVITPGCILPAMAVVTFRVPDDLAKALDDLAREAGTSRSRLLRELVAEVVIGELPLDLTPPPLPPEVEELLAELRQLSDRSTSLLTYTPTPANREATPAT